MPHSCSCWLSGCSSLVELQRLFNRKLGCLVLVVGLAALLFLMLLFLAIWASVGTLLGRAQCNLLMLDVVCSWGVWGGGGTFVYKSTSISLGQWCWSRAFGGGGAG